MKSDELRDDVVARAWRDAMRETPPAAVDDAIRAAARRAAGARPRAEPVAEAREPWRWWMPLAAAATIGAIAIGVIQSLPQDAVEPTVMSDAATPRKDVAAETARPAAAPPAATAARAPEIDTAKVAEGPAQANAQRQRSATAGVDAVTPAPRANAPAAAREAGTPMLAGKPSAAPATPKEAAPAASMDGTAVERDVSRKQDATTSSTAIEKRRADVGDASRGEPGATSGFVASPPPNAPPAVAPAASPQLAAAQAPRDVPAAASGAIGSAQPSDAGATTRAKAEATPARVAAAPAAGASPAPAPQAMAVTPPDVFVAEIRRLLAAGDREGAIRELQRFRRAHADADARLPEELRPFAAAVPRVTP